MHNSFRNLPTAFAVVFLASLLAAVTGSARGGLAAPQPLPQAEASIDTKLADLRVFDEVWSRVRDSFYDRNMHGLDWEAVGRRYRLQLAQSDVVLDTVVNRMLAELGASHTAYYTPDQTAYYDLADIFAGGLRRDLPKHFPNGEVSYVGMGIASRWIEGRYFVSGVFDGFPAAEAKLMVGDELIAVDGAPFEPVRSFRNKAGQKVVLTIRRHASGQTQDVVVLPQRLKPNEMYRVAMEKSARIIERNGRKIGYVHIWSYARSAYQELLEDLLSSGTLKTADALIWDLRDGWGGAQPDYLDIFDPLSPTMILTDRSGDREIVNAKWHKPVALLINEGTRSGKEVLAYGFKKHSLGPVVGTRSAGALLAGRAYLLSNGGLLLLAVADVSVDGERLEGRGVTPNENVAFDIRYAEGRDPQLSRALDLLTDLISN